eukprot:4283132-Prymnesium_polylepis.3
MRQSAPECARVRQSASRCVRCIRCVRCVRRVRCVRVCQVRQVRQVRQGASDRVRSRWSECAGLCVTDVIPALCHTSDRIHPSGGR